MNAYKGKYDELKALLDQKVEAYNCIDFIKDDPVSIPHAFSEKQDIEIAGFFASILAWGQRKTIINKCNELMQRMDNAPAEFIKHHQEGDLKNLLGFKHRTFNDTDLLYFVAFLQQHYSNFDSLEDAFLIGWQKQEMRSEFIENALGNIDDNPSGFITISSSTTSSPVCYLNECFIPGLDSTSFTMEKALNNFKDYFFSLQDFPIRTLKHISSPRKKATCKRLNMFLRWMVRKDNKGVDFGIWNRLTPAQLICPYDVHVDRVARGLGLVERKQIDWMTALELTVKLKNFEPSDPVKYDFALFGMGVTGDIKQEHLN